MWFSFKIASILCTSFCPLRSVYWILANCFLKCNTTRGRGGEGGWGWSPTTYLLCTRKSFRFTMTLKCKHNALMSWMSKFLWWCTNCLKEGMKGGGRSFHYICEYSIVSESDYHKCSFISIAFTFPLWLCSNKFKRNNSKANRGSCGGEQEPNQCHPVFC